MNYKRAVRIIRECGPGCAGDNLNRVPVVETYPGRIYLRWWDDTRVDVTDFSAAQLESYLSRSRTEFGAFRVRP